MGALAAARFLDDFDEVAAPTPLSSSSSIASSAVPVPVSVLRRRFSRPSSASASASAVANLRFPASKTVLTTVEAMSRPCLVRFHSCSRGSPPPALASSPPSLSVRRRLVLDAAADAAAAATGDRPAEVGGEANFLRRRPMPGVKPGRPRSVLLVLVPAGRVADPDADDAAS